MSRSRAPPPPPPRSLYKQRSWSPDVDREEVWLRRKGNYSARRQGKSITDDDLDELKACIELGFGFGPDSPDLDPKLSDALPAMGFYCAVNKQYGNSLSRSASESSILSAGDDGSNSSSMFDAGDDPEIVKTRLRQWAQAVACSVRQFSGEPK
uniref:Membrane insertase YidC n=1 Tax=Rhizophora mucronata TaxID=61149 RepID=A0A2P2NZN7_RHIMU